MGLTVTRLSPFAPRQKRERERERERNREKQREIIGKQCERIRVAWRFEAIWQQCNTCERCLAASDADVRPQSQATRDAEQERERERREGERARARALSLVLIVNSVHKGGPGRDERGGL